MKNILILYLSFRFVKDRNWTQKSSKLIVQNFSIGDPAAIASAMILVPIAVILMVIIPQNQILLAVDLAVLPFMVVMTIPVTRGNIFKTVIIGTVIITGGLLVGTNLSPLFTKAVIQAQFNMPSGATQISSICDGSNPLSWLIVKLMNNGFNIAILIAIFFLFLYFYKKYEKRLGNNCGSFEGIFRKI